MSRRLFISYSHLDADLLEELRVHLRPQERSGAISPWFDGYLVPGDDFGKEIRGALTQSDLIGLLVTPRFLASDYCVDIEMDDAIKRHKQGTARVVPIIAKPCGWMGTDLKDLLATPTNGKAITTWSNTDEAWTIVARDLEKAAKTAILPGGSRAMAKRTDRLEQPLAVDMASSGVRPARSLHPAFAVPRKFAPTDRDIDDFRHAAFEAIAEQFQMAIDALTGELSGRFRRIDANCFTATIYRHGKRVGGCTIYTGGRSFGSNGVAFNHSDDGTTNSMSEELRVHMQGEALSLKPSMTGMYGENTDQALSPEEGAAYLWKMVTRQLR